MGADDLLGEVGRIKDLDKRIRRLIEASDFGPNTAEVRAFLKRLDAFSWDDWRALQRAYVRSLKTPTLPTIKALDRAAAAAALSDQVMAAGWGAMDKFPVTGSESVSRLLTIRPTLPAQPDDIDGRLCRTACATAARAVAGRTLVSATSS